MSYNDFISVLPLIILTGTGFLVLMWDAFQKTASRSPLTLTILGGLGAIVTAGMNLSNAPGLAFGGLFFSNSYTHFFTIIFSAALILTALLSEKYFSGREVVIGEFSALLIFSAVGMVMLASGANLIVTFLGLETMSIAFYVLAGLFRSEAQSNEASLKYFLLGAFATGFFLYGIALIYGCMGTMSLPDIRGIMAATGAQPKLASPDSILLLLGAIMLIVGLAFKVAAFPFHQWAPDVYEGSPTVVSGFMSTAGKTAAFAAFALIFGYALIPNGHPHGGAMKIQMVLATLSALSMLYGNIVAVAQTKIKRMLAYSSIAHAGYLLLGVSALNTNGMKGIAVYSAVYMLMQIGAFGVVSYLEREEGKGLEISDYAGLVKRRPYLAILMSVLMLSLAGIPPFAGFFGKYYLFMAALDAGQVWLTVVAVVSSIIASYFYLRIIVQMYFAEGAHVTETAAKEGVSFSMIAVALAVIALVVFGVQPSLLLQGVGYFFQ